MPIDYGWTGETPPRQQAPQGQRSPTLAGTLNALGAGDTQPLPSPGLSLPGQGPLAPPPEPEGVVDFNRLGRLGMSGVGAALSLPRIMAWNAGPALVGRSGQGPQTGAEMFGRMGLDQNGPVAQGFGAGFDLLADPMMLMGGGGLMGRSAPAATGGIAQRLEQVAGSGLASQVRTEASRRAMEQAMQQMRAMPPLPPSPFTGAARAAINQPANPAVSNRLSRMAAPQPSKPRQPAGAAY